MKKQLNVLFALNSAVSRCLPSNPRGGDTAAVQVAGGDALSGNYGVKLFSMKVSSITIANSANAIVEAATNDTLNDYGFAVQVQNHAWGIDTTGGFFDDYLDSILLLRDAVRFVFNNQVVLVAGRGNDGNYNKTYPACYYDDWILNTGASEDDGENLTTSNCSSNKGGGVDFIAPGADNMIISTYGPLPNSYFEFNCTSSGAAHTSGIAALMLSYANDSLSVSTNLAPEDVEHVLQYTAEDRGKAPNGALLEGYDDLTGWGTVNAGNALLKIKKPKYRLLHFNAIDDTAQIVPVLSGGSIGLIESFNAIPAGTYNVNGYRVFDTVYHNLSANDTIIAGWVRNSSSDFWNYTGFYVTPEVDDTLEMVTKEYSIISGHYFQIVGGTYNGTYLPFNPASVTAQMAFTLWVNDTTLIDSFTQVEEVDIRSNISLGVYPNPATDQLIIEYNLLSASFTDVILVNMFGEHIKILQSPFGASVRLCLSLKSVRCSNI